MRDYSVLDQAAGRLGCVCQKDAPLAPLTTFKIGGPADRLLRVETEAQLSGLLAAVQETGLPLLVLGKGSDLLVGDRGFRGVVVQLGETFRQVRLLEDCCTLLAGAGAPLASVCTFARDHALTGLEFAWGIPGSVGGAVFMNAGAYGGEIKDVAVKVCHVDLAGKPGQLLSKELDFSYRHSAYSAGGRIITFAQLKLKPGREEDIAGKMEELMARRKKKQPYDMASAGSTFKRPKNGYAAALIESCHLKGQRVGGAQVSEKHAGFVVNTGGATCRDVLTLMEQIRETVLRQTGVELEPEVRMVGE